MEPTTKFDVAVCGTSLVNCILAAALGKAGMSVLHLDANEFYGEEEGTHDLQSFINMLEKSAATPLGFVRSVDLSKFQPHEHAKRFAIDSTPKALLRCVLLFLLYRQSFV
jgi:RAB protein geranylgeranyltransferase component A